MGGGEVVRGCVGEGWAGEVRDRVDREFDVVFVGCDGFEELTVVLLVVLVYWSSMVNVRHKILPLILPSRGELAQTIGVDALDTLADGMTRRPGKQAGSSQLCTSTHIVLGIHGG